ncbi:hypothetical protein AWZ03_010254 [Drosophila navojoa]|uniref:Uncharacterized protein n=1 Tax=Drosophila navojoa TaxID=7232 RepID=A0A484B3U1_DRONA|nr:signal transducer and activator of transcription B isoform X1 [Drosophila navojoa]TDG43319.1 hypothetical protein AWZ03_010254 [Drosophila navojoa]
MVAAVADVLTAEAATTATATATATTTPTLAATATLENGNSSDVQFAALTAASASGSQAATSNSNSKNNNCNNNSNNGNRNSISIHIDKHDDNNSSNNINNTNTNANTKNNNNMSDANVADAAKATGTTATPTTPTTTATTITAAATTKSAVSQRNVDIKIEKSSNMEAATQQLSKKVLKLDLGAKNLDEYSLKSPKSPIAARLPHQTSLTSSVDVEDRKTLREALYQGIFHRHRRTIFAVGSFLRMLRSRNSQYNTIRSSSEGEDIDEFLKSRRLFKLPHLFDR